MRPPRARARPFVRSFEASLAALFMTTMYWPGMTAGWLVPVSGAGVCATAAGASASAAASPKAIAEFVEASLP